MQHLKVSVYIFSFTFFKNSYKYGDIFLIVIELNWEYTRIIVIELINGKTYPTSTTTGAARENVKYSILTQLNEIVFYKYTQLLCNIINQT